MDWPKVKELDTLKKDVFMKLGKKLLLCDAEEYPDSSLRMDIISRYESIEGKIYCRSSLPFNVKLFVLAHELGHAWQEAIGVPRTRLKKEFLFAFYFHVDEHIKSLIGDLHKYIDLLNGLVMDRGADYIAKINDLFTSDAIEYCLREVPAAWSDETLIPLYLKFDPWQLKENLHLFAKDIMEEKAFIDSKDFQRQRIISSGIVDFANRWLRLYELGLITKGKSIFEKHHKLMRIFGRNLVEVINRASRDFKTAEGCFQIESALINYFGLPDTIFEIIR